MKVIDSFPRRVEVHEHVWIPMSDGCRLAARIWLPESAERDPVPAVLEYIPYRKRDSTRERDAITHPYLAGHGYAAVRVDMRGSGDSDGLLDDEYLELEHRDALEVMAWLDEQTWCTGSVGMMGKSWGGFNALQLAALQPPQLKAIVAVAATDDRYADDVHYMGGCLLGDNLSWGSVMFAYNSCPPDPELVGDSWREQWLERLEHDRPWVDLWLEHQRRDDYWKHGSVCEDFSAIQCPVMIVSGWADGYSNAVFRLVENLEVPRLGLIGPWSHKYPHLGIPGPAIGFLQEMVSWWDRWLKDVDNGMDREPVLRTWMQDSVPPITRYDMRPGRWVAEDSWPTPNVTPTTLALAPSRLVDDGDAGEPVELTVQSPLSIGLFAGKWCSYSATPDLPHDQREEDGGALVFDSDPLDEPLELLGAPMVELDVAANRPVAMVAVRLSDVAPDDKATRVTYGLLNLTHRDSHEHPTPLEPGHRYRVSVQLNDIAAVFPAGHRLRIAVSTSYWPLAWPPPEPVRLSVMTGSSSVTLPVREPRESDARLRPYEPPEGAPPIDTHVVEPGHHTWRVIRDLATDQSTLEVVKDEGTVHIDEIDLDLTDQTWEWYRSTGSDFTSLEGETTSVRGFARGDWSVRTVTNTKLTADATQFRVRSTLDAYEGDTRIFSRNWDRTVPRDLL
ncbi:MAG: CocE/NonD family hydrolase [Acidimicrobiales bacterium]